MPKLKPATQQARREHILDAAEHCFARAGFHGTTMQDICREADVSAGALYVYFGSKEALIDGIAARDRAKLAGELAELANAEDLVAALHRLGEHYTMQEPVHKRHLFIEIGVESTRNESVGEIFRSTDAFCKESFQRLFERARADGRIAPTLPIETIAQVLAVIGDGMFWRRAVDPNFDATGVMPVLSSLLSDLLNPTAAATAEPARPRATVMAASAAPEERLAAPALKSRAPASRERRAGDRK